MFIEFDYVSGGQVLVNSDQIEAVLPAHGRGGGTNLYMTGSELGTIGVKEEYSEVVSRINGVVRSLAP